METRTEFKTLSDLRKSKGLTLDQVGAELGVDPSLVSLLEHGKRRMTMDRADKFARLYGVGMKLVWELVKNIEKN